MTARSYSGQQVRASLWLWPLGSCLASFLVTLGLLTVRPPASSRLAELVWPGDASTATSMLQTVATATMTAAGLTFSLTVVALQLASQQFSPRLLRSFARDRVVQGAMALLIGTFVVSITALRGLDPERPLPVLALLLSYLCGLASAAMLVCFVAHIVRRLRVDTMMAAVHEDSVESMEGAYPRYGEGPPAPSDDLPGPEGGILLRASGSGFVQTIDQDGLVALARQHGVLLRLGLRPGDSVVTGAPIASAFPLTAADVDVDALSRGLQRCASTGSERTEDQDVGFGLRQIVDIAVRAISPSVNDPTTAAEAVGYCADLLVRLQGRRLGPQARADDDGTVRVVSPDRDLRYYLELSCAQIRRFGRAEPTVLTAVLRLLRDLAVNARDDEQRHLIAEQTALVLEETSDQLLEHDLAGVRDLARRVELALSGDADGAYRDRAGETRSI